MNIKVEKTNEIISCNSCVVATYGENSVNFLYRVKVGCMAVTLCRDCLQSLIGAAMVELSKD